MIKERILQIIEYYKIPKEKFFEKIGSTSANFRGENKKKSVGSDIIEKIFTEFPELNLDWLLTGNGPMLKEDTVFVPVLNLDARGGFTTNDVTDINQYTTGLMPFAREFAQEGDIVVPIFGDSMSPKYPSGSYVLVRPVELWREYLELGQTYVIELTDGRRIIKNIKRGSKPDALLLESINPDYDASEIPKSIIRSIFRVTMSVRKDVI